MHSPLSELKPYRDEFFGRCYKFEPLVSTKQASPGPQGGKYCLMKTNAPFSYIVFYTTKANKE